MSLIPNKIRGILILLWLCFTNNLCLFLTTQSYHVCAVEQNATKCWGRGNFWQLGYEDANDRGTGPNEMGDTLPEVDFGSNFIPLPTGVEAGSWHTCVVSTTNKVKCYGRNNYRQLGLGHLNDTVKRFVAEHLRPSQWKQQATKQT
eukprot:117942_1